MRLRGGLGTVEPMSVRERLLGSAMVATLWVMAGCSASNPRDINYGTDVGADFVPPEAGVAGDAGADLDGGVADVEVQEADDSAETTDGTDSIDAPAEAPGSVPDATVGAND